MKIDFLGDSITEGVWTGHEDRRYTSVLCKLLGATECNYGASGTRIAKQNIPSDDLCLDNVFYNRVDSMDKDADLVIVLGGTNDHGHGDALLGDMNSDSEYTFYGAMKQLVERLIEEFGREKLVFILPLPKFHQDNIYGDNSVKEGGVYPFVSRGAENPIESLYPLSAYNEAEKEILNHFNVRYLDFTDKFEKPDSQEDVGMYKDGLHPNEAGHHYLAELIAEELKTIL